MIVDSIQAQYGGSAQLSLVYAKLCSYQIDELCIPHGHQPPKFQYPKQHVAHLIKTCNNIKTYVHSMVKQFVHSLKGASFDWYTDLSIGSINSWDLLEQEFLTCFYSIRRTVGISELANIKHVTPRNMGKPHSLTRGNRPCNLSISS
ncbi:hypothetical protein CFOL_v3_13175 [Cephalotus follicularis]|uniref:Uncharacterized protein n=1 Tax=Cephalotus follicularis TaxID=3775 RepID=A0A1Q3BP74_CEPFO|nr:hypothetical protein CFOL_v3_13175 [Cephalotus follicularis]